MRLEAARAIQIIRCQSSVVAHALKSGAAVAGSVLYRSSSIPGEKLRKIHFVESVHSSMAMDQSLNILQVRPFASVVLPVVS
ncbi:hypothetical protein A9977_12370 [Variovorax sp. UMC13]|nr:hypothetical protein [Variovorax sp. UMC13]